MHIPIVEAYLVVKVLVHSFVKKQDFPTCGLPTIRILKVRSGLTRRLSTNSSGYREKEINDTIVNNYNIITTYIAAGNKHGTIV